MRETSNPAGPDTARSATPPANPDLQRITLATFARLARKRAVWSSHFTVCFAAGVDAQALALALLGLGGAVLLVSSDTLQLRSANQAGAIDFQVDSLGEAVRILKNELRRGTAVSVGLLATAAEVAEHMLLRGVQPDSVVVHPAGLTDEFIRRGAETISLNSGNADALSPGIVTDHAVSPATRKQQDVQLRDTLRADASLSREAGINLRWLLAARRLFPRDRERHILHPGSQDGSSER